MSEQTNSPSKSEPSKNKERKLMPPPRLELPDEIKPKFYVKKEDGEAAKKRDSDVDAIMDAFFAKIGFERGAKPKVKGKKLSDLEPIKIPEALLALRRPQS